MDLIEKKLEVIKNACEEKNGIDIEVLNIGNLTSIADYFVIVSGNSVVQTKAIAAEIDKEMYDNGYNLIHKEGYDSGRWILLDFEEIIVHIFHKDEREYYNLEKLWDEED